MTDRELLEFAAKAAALTGYIPTDRPGHGILMVKPPNEEFLFQTIWSPLHDDGDALRLAVKLHLLIDVSSFYGHTEAGPAHGYQCEMHCGDPYAATRRAIVRAAAEIGKAMP